MGRVSFEDIYIDNTIEDQKKYICDTDEISERIYYTLEDFNEENTPYQCDCQGVCLCNSHIYH